MQSQDNKVNHHTPPHYLPSEWLEREYQGVGARGTEDCDNKDSGHYGCILEHSKDIAREVGTVYHGESIEEQADPNWDTLD